MLEEDTYDELARLADDERVAPAVYARQVLEAHVRAHRIELEAPPVRPPRGLR